MARITQDTKTETKDNIILAATELFATQGFDKTKTKTIAQMCHIAEGTLFNYFPTKDDLLIAVFEHMAEHASEEELNDLPQPIDLLISIVMTPIKKMNRIPKGFLLDLFLSSIKMAKKKPKLFHMLAALDFKYIEQLKSKLDVYGDFRSHHITSHDLAEMMYGIIATDFLMYLYNKDQTFEYFEQKVIPKIKALVEPYLMEEF